MIQVNLEMINVIMRDENMNPFYYFQPQENAQLYFDNFEQFVSKVEGRLEPNRACHVVLPNWNDTGFIATVDAVYMGWEECEVDKNIQ